MTPWRPFRTMRSAFPPRGAREDGTDRLGRTVDVSKCDLTQAEAVS